VYNDLFLFLKSPGFNKKFYVHLHQVQNPKLVHLILQFLLAVKFGSNLPEKLRPEGVMEIRTCISYTKTLEVQTIVTLFICPPNLSMMLVWNFADPLLSQPAWFSQTITQHRIVISGPVHTYPDIF